MLKFIKEYDKYVAMTGFRNVKIENVREFLEKICREKPLDVEVQFFDAKCIATWQHLYFAALNALKVFQNRENVSKSLAMETMLYASAQRQIRRATELLGIKPKSSEIALLVIGDKPEAVNSAMSEISSRIKARPIDSVLRLTEEKKGVIRKIFGISDVELNTLDGRAVSEESLVNLVIERMALLSTQH